ncbi:MAG: hypothetical protein GY705_26270, partial [Bacteroidetes bacterium]|nr:hypothetical protein [Bacteroidota bacterium]
MQLLQSILLFSSYQKVYFNILVVLICIFLSSMYVQAARLDISVKGIEGKVYDNVVESLQKYSKPTKTDISQKEMKEMVKKAEKSLRLALEPFGYYSSQVSGEKHKNADGWDITFTVDKGLPIRIEEVEITLHGEGKESEELKKSVKGFPLRSGNILNHALYRKGKKDIINTAISNGFLNAVFTQAEIGVNRSNKGADIELHMDTGPQFYFGDIIFSQDLLEESLLARFLNFSQGEPYSHKKFTEFQRVLYETNYFSQVEIAGVRDKEEDFKVPVAISLKKPEYFNRYSFGIGYATDTGAQGKIEWDNRLFNKKGHTIHSAIKVSEQENEVELVYRVPVNDPRYDKLIYGGSWEDEEWNDTETRLYTAGVNYAHSGKRYKYGGSLEYQSERYVIGGVLNDSKLLIPGLNFSMVSAKNVVNTKNGFFVSLSLKGATEALFSDTDFAQAEVAGKLILTPFRSWRLIGKLGIG